MARANVPASAGVGSYPVTPVAANSMDLTETAADPVNLNQAAFGSASMLLLIFHNTHATNPGDVTIEGAPDGLNRDDVITDYVLQAGEIGFFFARRTGWRQADGNLYFDGSAATIKFAVIAL